MFPKRLSEVTAEEIQAVITDEIAESFDFELKAALPAESGRGDAWMSAGRIGDYAKDKLTCEVVAFANTSGGTMIVGIGEDSSKKAISPVLHIPRCREAAAILHQSISSRVEPRLPVFECEGVVTEPDGTSGVVIMRVLESYLAPHRNTQDNHCYVRRNDRAEPMSMAEIQEETRRVARSGAILDSAFEKSADRFFHWIPDEFRATLPEHGVDGHYVTDGVGNKNWRGVWALRLTARPLRPLPVGELPRSDWPKLLRPETFRLASHQGWLQNQQLQSVGVWSPRLRAIEREMRGSEFVLLDRIDSDGQLERFVWTTLTEAGSRPAQSPVAISEFMWQVASVLRMTDSARRATSRPGQDFAFEIQLMPSDPLYLYSYPGPSPRGSFIIPNEVITFPRYEIGAPEGFDELLTVVDRDLWNLAGYDPNWSIAIDWNDIRV